MTHIGLATCAVLLAGVAHAQTGEAPTTQVPGAMVTVEGCVTKDDSATSTVATQYVLTGRGDSTTLAARPASMPAAATSGATSSGSQTIPPRKMYVLRAESHTVDLAAHLNQMVRVVGATTAPMTTSPLAGRSPEATPNPAPTAPATPESAATGTMFDTANLPTLAVTSLVVLSPTCR